jgi:hypothetical protein
MTLARFTWVCACGLALAAACAKTDEQQPQAKAPASTQPSTEPAASKLTINHQVQWFPPARLRLSSENGGLVARLYSDDPRDIWKGEQAVNSYDFRMVLPDLSDPAQLVGSTWINSSSSMDTMDRQFGIFLNKQQDIYNPIGRVTATFSGQFPRVKVKLTGDFAWFHLGAQTPHPAPTLVAVSGSFDVIATVK